MLATTVVPVERRKEFRVEPVALRPESVPGLAAIAAHGHLDDAAPDTEVGASQTVQTALQRVPESPRDFAATGLPVDIVIDLLLKHILIRGKPMVSLLSEKTALPLSVIESVLSTMRQLGLVQVPHRGDVDARVLFSLSEQGRARAEEAMRRSQYVGPVPVTIADYVARVRAQAFGHERVMPDLLRRALAGMVLPQGMFEKVGAAMNSSRSLFIYGPSGSGKSYLSEHLIDAYPGTIWVPHAILVDEQIIQVFDPRVHLEVEPEPVTGALDRARQPDRRWVHSRRPVVMAGGELTLAMLDLEFDPVLRIYRAPLQMKANNGMLIVDDFGRQRSAVHDILNRWIVPLDRKVDHLTLHTGTKFSFPFDCKIIFSSNLSVSGLDDPAFVRRLGYKIFVGEMSRDEYRQVFAQACRRVGLAWNAQSENYLLEELHAGSGTPMMAAYPVDLLMKIRHRAQFEGVEPVLTNDGLRWAWALYFAPE